MVAISSQVLHYFKMKTERYIICTTLIDKCFHAQIQNVLPEGVQLDGGFFIYFFFYLFFLVDERREELKSTKNGPSSARQQNAI